jgi:hypothetical protein
MSSTSDGAKEIVMPTTPTSESTAQRERPKAIPFADLDLRDYLAAAAMTGLIHVGACDGKDAGVVAEHAYMFADKMIAARDANTVAVSAAMKGAK